MFWFRDSKFGLEFLPSAEAASGVIGVDPAPGRGVHCWRRWVDRQRQRLLSRNACAQRGPRYLCLSWPGLATRGEREPEDGRTKRTTDEKASIYANKWETARIVGHSARNCYCCLIHDAVPSLLREGTARGLQLGAFSRPNYARLANIRRDIARAHREPCRAARPEMKVDWRRGLPYKRGAL